MNEPEKISRSEARKQNKEFYYTGKACVRGHIALRRTGGGYCVECRPKKGPKDTPYKRAIANGEKFYFTGKPCPKGHIAKRRVANRECVECRRILERERQQKPERKEEKRQIEKRAREDGRRDESQKKFLNSAKRKAWAYRYNRKPEVMKKRNESYKRWLKDPQNKNIKSEIDRRNKKRRLKEDPVFRMITNYRRRVNLAFKTKEIKKTNLTHKLLGCSSEEFRNHLRSKYTNGMTDNNYGEWHIDHIIPIDFFDFSDEGAPFIAFHYLNTQPLWAKENIQKDTKLPKEYKKILKSIESEIQRRIT